MTSHPAALILAGAFACAVLAAGSQMAHGPALIASLDRQAQSALAAAGTPGIAVRFATGPGWLSRHPVLSGGAALDEAARTRAAQAIGGVPGIGGITWAVRPAAAQDSEDHPPTVLHCQQDVEAILKVRSIRFAEASAAIDPASRDVLDEVAGALGPCVGSIIAITGHTDSGGDAAGNLQLSRARAEAVRAALEGRGIPADGLRAQGLGAQQPLAGLTPADPANRRIEFSVIATMPVRPTAVDTPDGGAR